MFKDDDNKLIFATIIAVAVVATSGITGTWWYWVSTTNTALKAGYSQQPVPGSSVLIWVKK